MAEKAILNDFYELTPEDEALVAEGLADVDAGRVLTFEQVKGELADYILTVNEERKVAEAERQVEQGLVHTTEEVFTRLKEIREEWISKNPRGSKP